MYHTGCGHEARVRVSFVVYPRVRVELRCEHEDRAKVRVEPGCGREARVIVRFVVYPRVRVRVVLMYYVDTKIGNIYYGAMSYSHSKSACGSVFCAHRIV